MRHPSPSLERESGLGALALRAALLILAIAVVAAGLSTAGRPGGALLVPVRGVPVEELRDSFTEPRDGGRIHHAIDIPAPRGTPVLAVDDGVVFRLDESPRGGIAIYQWDAGAERCFYYGHLAGYSAGLAEGARVRRGETLGFVGSTGNASETAPHLHFEVHAGAGPDRCPSGRTVNPYGVLTDGGSVPGSHTPP